MITAADVVTAILALYPHMSGNNRQCIIEHRPQIEQVLVEAQRQYPNMPTEVFATIGFMETHLGCDRGEGGNWGAPISPRQRHIAGTPLQAATALWRSYEVCGSWDGAARRFRTGLCRPTVIGTRYSTIAVNITNRIRIRVNSDREHSQRVCLNSSNVCRSF
jgi:hypothetical protein